MCQYHIFNALLSFCFTYGTQYCPIADNLHFLRSTASLFNRIQLKGFYFHVMLNLVRSRLTNFHCDEEQKIRAFEQKCKNFQRFDILIIILDDNLHTFLCE